MSEVLTIEGVQPAPQLTEDTVRTGEDYINDIAL